MIKKMRIGKILILTFILVTLISSIASIIGLFMMKTIDSSYSGALINYGFSQGDIGLFNSEFNHNRVVLSNIVLDPDAQKMMTDTGELAESSERLDHYLAAMERAMLTKGETDSYNRIKEDLNRYKDLQNQVVADAVQNKDKESMELLTEKVDPIAEKIADAIETLIKGKTEAGKKVASDLSAQETVATVFILALIVGSLLISLFIAVTISRSISNPVQEMVVAVEKLAEGDLNAQVNVNSENEIGRLGAAFSITIQTLKAYITDIKTNLSMVEQGDLTAVSTLEYKGDFIQLQNSINGIVSYLKDNFVQINRAAEQVSVSSEQVSGGAQALASGATEQASSVEELSATVNEIFTHVKANAEHAVEASENVNRVQSEIEVSDRYMKDMVSAMSLINESSSQIGRIIKTIEDIAFQTNILALNAAVEAARAGAAGKGFAVVADEVRNLASKSADAAKDTTALIEGSMHQVENGTKIANDTAQSLVRVVESAKSVSETIGKISQASNRQSDAIGQVTLGLDQISNVVQINSATAEESAAASKELSEQALALKELVQKFKLEEEAEPGKNGIEEIDSGCPENRDDGHD